MILHKYKAVLFHIPKTAGYSMEQYFAPGDRDYRVFDPEYLFGLKDGVMTQHLPYSGMINLVPQSVIDGYFKFAFVRNPWDRLVSAYCYLKKAYDKRHGDFASWLTHVCSKVESKTYAPGAHFAPQIDFLFHDSREVLDFVGRFETVQSDFAKVCGTLGVPYKGLPEQNRSALRDGHYSGYYSDELVELVSRTYRAEIEFLGYRFDTKC